MALRTSGDAGPRVGQAGLLLVCLVYVGLQLATTSADRFLEWDEAVYLSQVSPFVPAAPFEVHRARGITLLAVPPAAITTAMAPLRYWLMLVSTAGLYFSFRPWARVFPGAIAPLAALLFISSWVAVFYGSELSPNLYGAFGFVAAIGYSARVLWLGAGRPAMAGLAAAVAFVALMRPSDSAWLVAFLGLFILLRLAVDRRAALRAAVATGAGLAIGWLPWVLEAWMRFGGPVQRFRQASEAAQPGLYLTLSRHLRILDGALVCCFGEDTQAGIPVMALAWWIGLLALAAAGILLARPGHGRLALLLATVTALGYAASYLLLTPFVYARFLLPTYALLGLAAAVALVALVRAARRRRVLLPVAVLAAAALLAHAAWQFGTLRDLAANEQQGRLSGRNAAAQAAAELDIDHPCVVLGARAPALAFQIGCHTGGINRREHVRDRDAAMARVEEGHDVLVFWQGRPPEHNFLREWEETRLHDGWRVWRPTRSSASRSHPP